MKRLLKRILGLSACVLLLLTAVLVPAAAYDAENPYVELQIVLTDEFDIPSGLTATDTVIVSAIGGGIDVRDGQYNGSYINENLTSELVYKPSGYLVYRLYDVSSGAELIKLNTTSYGGEGCWAGDLNGTAIDRSLLFTLNQSTFYFYGGNSVSFNEGLIALIDAERNPLRVVTSPEGSMLAQIQAAREEAYKRGFSSGKVQGYSEGYEDGVDAATIGEGEVWQGGYNNGYRVGYEDGVWQGKQEGQTEALNSTSTLKDFLIAIVTAPGYLIDSILNFDLLGINVAALVKTVLTLGISALILWFIFKIVKG